MAITNGARAAHLEGIIRSVSKDIYGRGPRDIRCECRGNVYLVRCKGVLTPVEIGLADQGPDGVVTLKKVRCKLFERERELIKEQFEGLSVHVEAVLQDFHHDRDERLLVVLTETQ